MKAREVTGERLVLRSGAPWIASFLLLLGLGLAGGGLADILTERGENGGWFATPAGLILIALGAFLLLSPVDMVLNRAEGTLLRVRRGPWERVIARHDLPAMADAIVMKERRRTGNSGYTAWQVLLVYAGDQRHRFGPFHRRKARAERLAGTLRHWLKDGAPP